MQDSQGAVDSAQAIIDGARAQYVFRQQLAQLRGRRMTIRLRARRNVAPFTERHKLAFLVLQWAAIILPVVYLVIRVAG